MLGMLLAWSRTLRVAACLGCRGEDTRGEPGVTKTKTKLDDGKKQPSALLTMRELLS